jgi:hypothetical protein
MIFPPGFEASTLREASNPGGKIIWVHAEANRLEAGGLHPIGG